MRISDWSSDVCSSDLVDGVKTWTLDNGVSIRTLTAGGVDKVTIHAPHEEVTTRKGYYFVYLFGSFTDESAKAYGWRIERDTDKVTPIKGMPFELFNNADNPGDRKSTRLNSSH